MNNFRLKNGQLAPKNDPEAMKLKAIEGKQDVSHIDPSVDVRDLNKLLPLLTSVQDVADVWDALKQKAKRGDTKAASMILERLGGKPKATQSTEQDLFDRFVTMAQRYRTMTTQNDTIVLDQDD